MEVFVGWTTVPVFTENLRILDNSLRKNFISVNERDNRRKLFINSGILRVRVQLTVPMSSLSPVEPGREGFGGQVLPLSVIH